jgi:DNA-3-methyladenine glycosylase II
MPTKPSRRVAEATAAVAGRDAALAGLIERAGPCGLRGSRDRSGDFAALVEAIVYQQLAGRAAAAIHARFRALIPGDLTPVAVLALSEEDLRGAGLSGAKTVSIRDLAAKVADGTVPLRGIARLTDDEVVGRLTTVRGIGRWTAEMFLLFRLGRLDVWPVDDLAVRAGYGFALGLPVAPTARWLRTEGDRFRPYRSIVAWYCWQAVRMSRGQPLR